MADSALQVWVADPLVKIVRDAPKPANTPDKVCIDAVRNEYENGQIVVTAGTRIEKLTAGASPLVGREGPKPRVEVCFPGFVPLKRGTSDTPPEHLAVKVPADVPDPLLDKKSVSVEAGKNQPVWITVYVPKTARPGVYSGSVDIVADGASTSVPISVNVLPVTLPDERTLQVTNWITPFNVGTPYKIDTWSERYWKILAAYARLMADHRQNVIITPVLPLIKGHDDGKGNLTFDFTLFDRWVETFQKAGVIGTIEGGHLGGRKNWDVTDFDGYYPEITNPDGSVKKAPDVTVTSPEYQGFLSQFLPALMKHLDEKGWREHYIQHLVDEPIAKNAESYKGLAASIRKYAPGIKIIDACMSSNLAGAIDIWVPQPPHFNDDIQFFKDRQKAGDTVWTYTCLSPKGKYMNRFIDYPLLDVRLLHWANFKYNLPGYLHWGGNYWMGDPFTVVEPEWDGGASHLPPGDSHIFYPDARGPVGSIRLDAMRDGIEDYELLKLLEKRDPKKAHEICDSIVKSLTDYTLDPAEFREARAMIIKGLAE